VSQVQLTTKLTEFLSIKKREQEGLARLGIVTVRDLLYYFPVRYGDISQVTTISQTQKDEVVTVYGVISKLSIGKTFKQKIPSSQAVITDIEGTHLKVLWLNQAFIGKTLKDGMTVKLTGKITENQYGKSLLNPEFERVATMPIDTGDSLFREQTDEQQQFGFPVYRETRGLSSRWIYHAVIKVLGSGILDTITDPLPEYILAKYRLPSIATALVWAHTPRQAQDATAARKRFSFEEIFLIQVRNQQVRYHHRSLHAYPLAIEELGIDRFIKRFPFEPTDGQKKVVASILENLSKDEPMVRLVEGDVGSGKTFVAAVAAYATITNRPRKSTGVNYNFGHLQVAYMAPTEVLATQLFENFIEYFKGTNIAIGLVTGSGCRKFPSKVPGETWTTISRPQLLKWVANGEIPIVIGTHALIQKKVQFQDLALVIIDEQHRFGTRQRMELSKKEARIPHYLSMTATPIPRTLALTIYGDLDLSVLEGMPTGRKPVITEIVSPDPDEREKVYEKLRAELAQGRQAYVICPRIDEADPSKEKALQLKSVKSEAQRLAKHDLADYRIGIMHSKMTKQAKEEAMLDFYEHRIDVLVSTSVVEVGVNVPNATNIIIEGAERFGLAQLHQLRGRVMRSSDQAYCYLFAETKTESSLDRLKALANAKNGFELAEIDLGLRGTGDLAGSKQWGISDLAMEAIKNITMVEFARNEAKEIIENDPRLDNFPEIKERIIRDEYSIHLE
jgi:ATP-dependent DNA helicase RecG